MYQTISNLPGLVSVHCKSRSPQEFNGLWKVCSSAPFQFCFPRVLNNFQAFQNSGDVEDAAHWSKKKDKIKIIYWCRRQRKMKGKKRKKEQNIWKSGNRPGTPSFWAKFLVWKTSSTDCTPSDATCWFEKSWRILRKKINVVVAMDLAVELLGAQLLQGTLRIESLDKVLTNFCREAVSQLEVWELEGVKRTSLILAKAAFKFWMKRGVLAGWRWVWHGVWARGRMHWGRQTRALMRSNPIPDLKFVIGLDSDHFGGTHWVRNRT